MYTKKIFSFSDDEMMNLLNDYIKSTASLRFCTESRVIEDALLLSAIFDPYTEESLREAAKGMWTKRYEVYHALYKRYKFVRKDEL